MSHHHHLHLHLTRYHSQSVHETHSVEFVHHFQGQADQQLEHHVGNEVHVAV